MTHITPETQAKIDEQRDRLAAQLRANLSRRKQQSRAREDAGADKDQAMNDPGEPR